MPLINLNVSLVDGSVRDAIMRDAAGIDVAHLTYIEERGKITMVNSSASYKISHVFSSGVWKLVSGNNDDHVNDAGESNQLIYARKPHWYKETLELRCGNQEYKLKMVAKKGFVMTNSFGKVADYKPSDKRLRSYTVVYDGSIRAELVAFGFWMVGLLNKRTEVAALKQRMSSSKAMAKTMSLGAKHVTAGDGMGGGDGGFSGGGGDCGGGGFSGGGGDGGGGGC